MSRAYAFLLAASAFLSVGAADASTEAAGFGTLDLEGDNIILGGSVYGSPLNVSAASQRDGYFGAAMLQISPDDSFVSSEDLGDDLPTLVISIVLPELSFPPVSRFPGNGFYGFGGSSGSGLSVSNDVISRVPIPAAFWLFPAAMLAVWGRARAGFRV